MSTMKRRYVRVPLDEKNFSLLEDLKTELGALTYSEVVRSALRALKRENEIISSHRPQEKRNGR